MAKYIAGKETITIRSGLVTKRIFIRDIKQISNTKNPIAAHALSFERLEIVYDTHKKKLFLQEIKNNLLTL